MKRKMMGATCGGVILAAVVAGCSSSPNDDGRAHYADMCQDQRPGPTQGQRAPDSACDSHTPGFKEVDIAVPDSPGQTEWVMTDHTHWYAPWSHYSTLDPYPFVNYNYGGAYIPPYGQVINRQSIVVVPAGTPADNIARGFAGGGGRFTQGGGGLASYAPGSRVTVAGRAFSTPGAGVSGVGNSISGGASGRAASGSVGSYAGSGTVSRGGLGISDSNGGSAGRGGFSAGDSAGS